MNPLPAVIVRVPHQKERVEKLVEYLRNLDGSELHIIDGGKDDSKIQRTDYNRWKEQVATMSFHQAAVEFKGQPFIWMEPDAIPLKANWINALTEAYVNSGKHFLLSSDSHPPHDLVTGIGIYGPDTHWIIPEIISGVVKKPLDPIRDGEGFHGWDLWMLKHLKPLIGFTPLIQHDYGIYDEEGFAAPHMFPRDNAIIRQNAVIFHADKLQQLIDISPITEAKRDKESFKDSLVIPRFYHTGDLGDIIASLPVIRQIGGGDLIIGNHHPGCRDNGWRKMEGERFNAIRTLLEAQPYIRTIRFEHRAGNIDFDFSHFRRMHSQEYSLSEAQARWLRVPNVDMRPWLETSKHELSKGKIVISRTRRYHNHLFPWRTLARKYGKIMLFIGLREEYDAFVRDVGGTYGIQYIYTQPLLDTASLIANSDLFIGNQSCPCWLAMGLGHNLIQETHDRIRDSIVPRDNAYFFKDNKDNHCFEKFGLSLE